MKKHIQIALVIAVLALTLFACGGSDDVDTGEKSGESSASGETQEEQSGAITYSQNDAVEIDGKEISILEVENYTDYDEFSEPEEGYKYIAIKIKVENISDESVSYNALNYTLKNEDGTEYTEGWVTIKPTFNSGTLQPTKVAQGYVAYEVDEGVNTSKLEFYYEPGGFDDSQVIWELD